MKTLFISITALFLSFNFGFSQQNSESFKINYVANGASDFFVNSIKKQIKDEAQLSYVLSMLTDSKVYYSLFVDNKSNTSFFSVDSTDIAPGVSTAGYFNEVSKDDQQMYGEELFMDGEILFSGKVEDLEWKFTDETKEILGYTCSKAVLSSAPGYYVWFSQKIPINDGPGIYKGLPGLVLEVNTPFEFITVLSMDQIKAETYPRDIQLVDNDPANATSLVAMLAKKDNVKRMIEEKEAMK